MERKGGSRTWDAADRDAIALRLRSNVEAVVQYGRMDVTQANLAYIGTMAYPE